MGKLGDLFVKLGLHKEEYEKGMDQAKKKSETFGATIKKMSKSAKAAWAAIGFAVTAIAKDIVESSNTVGDALTHTWEKAKSSWEVFKASLTSWDWKKFGKRISESWNAAETLTSVNDTEFEILNSIKLQRAKMSNELADLELKMRDLGRSDTERIAAGKQYLALIKDLYSQEMKLRGEQSEANKSYWLATAGIEDTAETRRMLEQFLVDYGKDAQLINSVGVILAGQKKSTAEEWVNALNDLADYQSRTGNSFAVQFARAYEKGKGDKQNQKLVDAIEAFALSKSAYDRETKRVQTMINSLIAKSGEDGGLAEIDTSAFDKVVNFQDTIDESFLEWEMPDIFDEEWVKRNVGNFDEVMAHIEKMREAANILADGLSSGISAGLDTLAEALAGVEGVNAGTIVSAVLTPLADAAVKAGMLIVAQGVAVEAFKSSLDTLDGPAAIIAGTALIAIGVATKAGLAAIAKGGSSAGSTSTSSSGFGSNNFDNTDLSSELTIYVKGTLSGRDIVLSGERTINSWAR